jgi:hypothetical protein
MTFDLSNNYDVNKAQIKFAALIASGKKIELKEIKPRRSLSQNKYFHVVVTCTLLHTEVHWKKLKPI